MLCSGGAMTSRRNFSSSPIYRSAQANLEHYEELVMRCRKQDINARDGHGRRAAERIRMTHELNRLADIAFRSGFPTQRERSL